MNPFTYRLAAAFALALAAGAPAFAAAPADALRFSEPWIREAPPTAKVMGGYFELENPTAKPLKLVGITCPAFGEVQMHSMVEEEGRMKMVHHRSWPVSAHGAVHFAPGGNHLMLMRPVRPLKAGETVKLEFDFGAAGRRVVSFPVRSMVEPHGHHEH